MSLVPILHYYPEFHINRVRTNEVLLSFLIFINYVLLVTFVPLMPLDKLYHLCHYNLTPLAATASVLTMTREVSEVDYTAVGSAVTTITSNLTELSKSGRMIAALLSNEGQDCSNLLKAAQDLASATGKFLQQVSVAMDNIRFQMGNVLEITKGQFSQFSKVTFRQVYLLLYF